LAVLAEKLVEIIESRADDLSMTWYREVKESHWTPNVKNLSEEEALAIARRVYSKLSHWLIPQTESEVQETYLRFGEQCYYKGFRMEEMVMLLVLIKRHLWLHLLEQGVMTTNIEVYQALDVNNKVVLYFDRAIYFSLIGFKKAREESVKAKTKAES
jgi:hypothetical protein